MEEKIVDVINIGGQILPIKQRIDSEKPAKQISKVSVFAKIITIINTFTTVIIFGLGPRGAANIKIFETYGPFILLLPFVFGLVGIITSIHLKVSVKEIPQSVNGGDNGLKGFKTIGNTLLLFSIVNLSISIGILLLIFAAIG